ncbi:MAG: hypothetical protein ACI8V4_000651 [Ilumatobacter sp.]|jgi:hypothetical protein
MAATPGGPPGWQRCWPVDRQRPTTNDLAGSVRQRFDHGGRTVVERTLPRGSLSESGLEADLSTPGAKDGPDSCADTAGTSGAQSVVRVGDALFRQPCDERRFI